MSISQPAAAIVGYHQDEQGDWVAELSCGHSQHVRHKPPWQLRPWVETEAGRQERIGAQLDCPACRMRPLPEGLKEYRRTAVFDEQSVPKGLLRDHRLKASAWGEIVVLDGRVSYFIEGEQPTCVVLSETLPGAVWPEEPHRIAPQPGARFFVRFLRKD